VDTGFSGGVLIPFWMFERMSLLSYLTPDEYYAVMADTRRIRLYTATGVLTLGSKKHTVNIHSSPYIDKKIVGRDFLKKIPPHTQRSKEPTHRELPRHKP
jgi:hypothetical protein